MLIKNSYYLLFVILFFGCQKTNYVKVESIEVPEVLIVSKKNYKKLVIEAKRGDINSINEMLSLDFGSDMQFYNGIVVMQIIDEIGEDLFIKKINRYSNYEKLRLLSILEAGFFENKLEKFKDKKVSDVFPKLKKFLSTR